MRKLALLSVPVLILAAAAAAIILADEEHCGSAFGAPTTTPTLELPVQEPDPTAIALFIENNVLLMPMPVTPEYGYPDGPPPAGWSSWQQYVEAKIATAEEQLNGQRHDPRANGPQSGSITTAGTVGGIAELGGDGAPSNKAVDC